MRERASVIIAFGLALATAAAFWRRALSGDFAPGPELVRGQPAILFGVGVALSSVAYLAGIRSAPERLSIRHLVLALAIQACAASAPPFTSTDARMNVAYGRLAHLGLNPYTTPPAGLPAGDPYRRGLDWPGMVDAWGPITVHVGAVAARMEDPRRAVSLFKLIILVAVVLTILVAFGCCRSLSPVEGGAAFFFFACNPLLAWELSGQAHNDALLLLPATGFVWLAIAGKRALALLLLFLGCTVKYGLAAALGLYWLLFWREDRRRCLIATVLAILMLLALWAPFFQGMTSLRGLFVAAMANPARIVNSPASFVALVSRHVDLPLLRAWFIAVLAVLLGLGVRYGSRADNLTQVMSNAFGFTLLYQLLAMPSYWPWYATWLLPLALAGNSARERQVAGAFTALAPALYFTGVAGAAAIIMVSGATLFLWLRPVMPPEAMRLDAPTSITRSTNGTR